LRTFLPAALLSLLAGTAAFAATPPPAVIKEAPVALLADLGSGEVLYAERAGLRFVPASMTKVMTAYVAFELMAQGKLKPTDRYTVKEETARQWSGKGTSLFLKPGESVPVDALLHGLATVSANDASVVLAEGFAGDVPTWTKLMNAEARRLGMSDSHFGTPNGWPDNGSTFVSAVDLVKLSQAMIERHPALYRSYFGQKRFTWDGVTRESHDPTVGIVPGADGIKTGHTREAGFNFLGSAQRGRRRLVMVVAGARSEEKRAEMSRELLEWGFSAWTRYNLFSVGTVVGTALVQDGSDRSVGLLAPQDIYAAIPKDAAAPVGLAIRYDGPLVAPIVEGAQIAELEIRWSKDAPPSYVPLRAAKSVPQAGFFHRLLNGLASFFG
jgi:D-alanyl-D-alanine carboxypeptidase (penicillin-binding protein 5/6)